MVLPKHRWLPGWVAEFAAAAELPSSMCFGESFAVPIYDRIDEGEYYRHVFAHPTGISHKADGSKEGVNTLGRPDAFSYAVLDRSKKMDRTEDAIPFERVFKAYRAKDIYATKSGVNNIEEDHTPHLLRMLVMKALMDKRLDVLGFRLDKARFDYEQNFTDKASLVTEKADPEVYKLLTESDFGKKHRVG